MVLELVRGFIVLKAGKHSNIRYIERFNVHTKKRKPRRLCPNQPSMANYGPIWTTFTIYTV